MRAVGMAMALVGLGCAQQRADPPAPAASAGVVTAPPGATGAYAAGVGGAAPSGRQGPARPVPAPGAHDDDGAVAL